MVAEPRLVGVKFRDAVHRYATSSLIGVVTAAGETLVPPPLDRAIAEGDRVIAISEDDDTVLLDGAAPAVDEAALVPPPPAAAPRPERTLVLGAGARLAGVLTELDQYVAPQSETLVVAEAIAELPRLAHMRATTRIADITDRGALESLDVTSFDHILVLSERAGRTQDMADARTMVTLLHLRDLERLAGKQIPITSEILDIGNRELASVSEADDFIVSNTLVSLMLSQIAENPHLVHVFDELFDPEGHELYLKPATDYVRPGAHAFGAVCAAALGRGEVAIGYRLAKAASDPAAAFGVAINPRKTAVVELGPGDKLIVLAEQ